MKRDTHSGVADGWRADSAVAFPVRDLPADIPLISDEAGSAQVRYPMEYRQLARRRLTGPVWDYVEGGSGAELTVAANSRIFDEQLHIVPRVLVDVAGSSSAGTLLGAELALPVGVAPMAYQRLIHPAGEIAMARGAAEAGALCVVSIFASSPLADIAAAGGPLWLQVYWLRRREVLADLVRRARDSGYRALVLTVDVPRLGLRLRDQRNGFAVPPEVGSVNLDPSVTAAAHRSEVGESALANQAQESFDQSVTWADLAWLRETAELPVLVKGILSGADARLAVEHGAAGIIVSNHGGRQLDGGIPSLRALPDIVAAVAGRCPVLLDGGVRRGRDVFLALALGADAVLVGRPALWALAEGGAAAVAHQLGLIHDELVNTMALAGRPSLAELDATAVDWAGPGHG